MVVSSDQPTVCAQIISDNIPKNIEQNILNLDYRMSASRHGEFMHIAPTSDA